MSTRYAMPPRDCGIEDGAGLARLARGLAALLVVSGLMSMMVWAAWVPPEEPPVVVVPQAEESLVPVPGVLPGA